MKSHIIPSYKTGRQGLGLLRRERKKGEGKKKATLTTPPISSWLESRMFWCVNLEKTELGRHQHRSGWRREVQGQSSHKFSGQEGFLGLFFCCFLNCREVGKIKEWGKRSGRTHMQGATFPEGITHALRCFWTLWTWKHIGQWDFQNWNQRKAESCQMKILKRKFLFKTKWGTEWQMGLFLSEEQFY